ncbi:Transcriptional regulator, AbiEi antitoxin, Type IV TA system [Modestobacter sp. DSM 44400]|uniref:endonuclease domain-containing protein n=1 Tax=Modestobacter sp. DSM 44400 TaxID=1550230 RepID=UPI00089BD803|nr:DUF559 domain-containing protein [Modestobacter sp. DSM 44400]SDY07354.1 Transcriptional regulator, AbiEi antitoxin, Type IV TA system [Modestobacter sp. DSM 44400]
MHQLAFLLPDGVARREDITLATSASSVSRWMSRGDVVLLHPGVLVLADRAEDWLVRARAASLWTRGPLSHLSALTAAGLLVPSGGPVHVTVPADRFPRGCADVVAHRTTAPIGRIEPTSPPRLPVARSIVDAWSWAHSGRRNPRSATEQPVVRRLVIEAVRQRAVRTGWLRAESGRQPLHGGRVALSGLLDLVEGGCQSELEVWGVTHVLRIPEVPAPVQQHRVVLADGRSVFLDAAYREVRVAVELDGAQFHDGRQARERDMRRDSALAVLGWVVLRFSYQRLTQDPAGCRAEIEAVVRRRLGR